MRDREVPTAVLAAGRRRYPRLVVTGQIRLRSRTSPVDMHVVDVSHGGCHAVSTGALAVGVTHDLRLAIADGEPLPITARVIHCQIRTGTPVRYDIGWQWADDASTVGSVAQLIDRLTEDAEGLPSTSPERPVQDGPRHRASGAPWPVPTRRH